VVFIICVGVNVNMYISTILLLLLPWWLLPARKQMYHVNELLFRETRGRIVCFECIAYKGYISPKKISTEECVISRRGEVTHN
jgi:hypothetical protein